MMFSPKTVYFQFLHRQLLPNLRSCNNLFSPNVCRRPLSIKQENMENNFKPFPHFATNALHVGQEPEQWNSMAVVPPISLATTFKQQEPGKHGGFEYSRSGNPTREVTEKCIASLEGGKHCMLMSSGLAATVALTHLLNAGEHVIAMDDLYGGTNRYFNKVAKKFNIETTMVDATNPENVKKALRPTTRMVWLETPTNPMMQICDIEAITKVAHAQPNVFVVVDNTFASPYFQRPLDFGADCVLHSISKYINGHSDVIMGCVVTSNDALHDQLRFLQNAIGPVPSPFDCYMVNRGLKTLAVRMKEHQKNGLAVAQYLETNPRVLKVLHPGLPSHPQYELAKKQMRGFSGMISMFIKGGLEESSVFLSSLKVFTLAESLGGYESLAEHPAIMTHASVPAEQRQKLGIHDNFIRLSVGLEDIEDLIKDLEDALVKAVPNV